MATLKLYLAYIKILMEKESCKKCSIGLGSPGNLKIIFALLTEVVEIYVQFIIIHFQYLSLKMLLALCQRLSKSLVLLQVGFHKLFEQFIGSD